MSTVRPPSRPLLLGLLAGSLLDMAGGCNDRAVAPQRPPFGGACGPPGQSPALRDHCWEGLSHRPQVDLLLVVDDGASMAGAQARLAAAMDVLVAEFTAHDTGLDLRLGIARPSDRNCGGERFADLVPITSCRERRASFVAPDGTDAFDDACAAVCELETLAVEPSTTLEDPTPRVRPWIDVGPGGTNLPAGPTVEEALRCAVPQGISGCEHSALLESVDFVWRRSNMPDQDSRGFFREGAGLAVVLMSDGVDCSVDSDWLEIFDPDGSRVLWSDPEADAATPAVCWNAGVACTSDGSAGELECESVTLDAEGQPTDDRDARLMRPPGEYVELLEEMSQSWTDPRRPEPVVLGLVGVAEPPEATVYAPSSDEDVQREHGIGAGCEGPDGPALPPVRVREYVERAGGSLSSICADDFSAPMAGLADSLAAMAPSMCMPLCAADVEPDVEGLQVECHVDIESWRDDGRLDRYTLARCDGDEQEPVLPPEELLCWYPRTGSLRAPECKDAGQNLEFGLLWGETRPAFSQLVPSCRQLDHGSPCPHA